MSGQREAADELRTAAERLGARVTGYDDEHAVECRAVAALLHGLALHMHPDGYTTWDVDEHLPGKGWKPDDPKVLAWEAAHGHDARLKCYPEYGCQLLMDPADVIPAALAVARAVSGDPS